MVEDHGDEDQGAEHMTAELDEWRTAVDDLNEAERVANCGHTCRGRRGVCVDCGELDS